MGKALMEFSMSTGNCKSVWLCLRKDPDRAPYSHVIETNLRALQADIGGHIETVTLTDDIVVICDEEGRLKGLPYNCTIAGVDFCGPVLVLGVEGDDFATLPQDCPLDELCQTLFGCLPWHNPECDTGDDDEICILFEEEDEIYYTRDEEDNIVWYPSLPDDMADDAEIMVLDDEEGDDDDAG